MSTPDAGSDSTTAPRSASSARNAKSSNPTSTTRIPGLTPSLSSSGRVEPGSRGGLIQAGHGREGDYQTQGEKGVTPQPEIQDVADEYEDGAASGARQEPERRGTQVTALHTGALMGISRTSPVPARAPRFAATSPGRLPARPPRGRVDPSGQDTRCRLSV